MAVHMTGLGVADYAEIVDLLHARADELQTSDPDGAAWRRDIADRIGDGLDSLPRPTKSMEAAE